MARGKSRPAAFDRAAELLGDRPRTRAELRQRLDQEGYRDEAIGAALAELERRGWLDDLELGVHFIGTRAQRLGHGPLKLREALEARGLSASEAERAWQAAVERGEVDPDGLLRHAVARRLAREASPPGPRALARVYNALLRAGFAEDEVRRQLEPHGVEADPDLPPDAD